MGLAVRRPAALSAHTLRENPQAWVAHNNLATAYIDHGKIEQAQEHYRAALQLKPDYDDAHNNLALLFLMQNKLDEAISEYREAISIAPTKIIRFFYLGKAFNKHGDWLEAERAFRQTMPLDPQNAEVHFLLGIALDKQGKSEQALQEYRLACKFRPNWAKPMNNLAWILATHQDPGIRNGPEALKLAMQLPHCEEYDASQMPLTLAAAYAEMRQFPQAADTIRQAAKLVRADRPGPASCGSRYPGWSLRKRRQLPPVHEKAEKMRTRTSKSRSQASRTNKKAGSNRFPPHVDITNTLLLGWLCPLGLPGCRSQADWPASCQFGADFLLDLLGRIAGLAGPYPWSLSLSASVFDSIVALVPGNVYLDLPDVAHP